MMAAPTCSTFFNGEFAIFKTPVPWGYWWVGERDTENKMWGYRQISPEWSLHSKSAAVDWLMDTLQEEHDLSQID